MMTSRDLHIQTRQLFTIVGSISVLLVLAQVAHASTVIGATGAYDNGGTPNTIFEVDVTTGVLTDLGSTGSVVPNSLACNVEENLLYYGDHSGTDLYRFNLDTLANDHVADLVSIFGTGDLVAGQILSGAATYDSTSKRYYFIPEEASSGSGAGISWLEFNRDSFVPILDVGMSVELLGPMRGLAVALTVLMIVGVFAVFTTAQVMSGLATRQGCFGSMALVASSRSTPSSRSVFPYGITAVVKPPPGRFAPPTAAWSPCIRLNTICE